MDDPVTGGLLPDPLLHEGLLAAEELHGQLVVGGLEQGLQLVLDEALLDLLAGQARAQLLLRRAVQGDIVHPEVDLATPLVIHLVACANRNGWACQTGGYFQTPKHHLARADKSRPGQIREDRLFARPKVLSHETRNCFFFLLSCCETVGGVGNRCAGSIVQASKTQQSFAIGVTQN